MTGLLAPFPPVASEDRTSEVAGTNRYKPSLTCCMHESMLESIQKCKHVHYAYGISMCRKISESCVPESSSISGGAEFMGQSLFNSGSQPPCYPPLEGASSDAVAATRADARYVVQLELKPILPGLGSVLLGK